MDETTLNAKLQELILEISNIPEYKRKLSTQLVRDSKDKLNESLEDLRLLIKYLLFDLEATKRERDQLKGTPDKKTRRKDDDEPDKVAGEV